MWKVHTINALSFYHLFIPRRTRIVIGEVRDPEATVSMLQALNTGHSGLSTGHANSAKDMLGRLETLMIMGTNMPLLAAKKQISTAIDIIVHLGRMRDKTRRVLEILEVLDVTEGEFALNPLFQFKEHGEQEDGAVKGILESTGTSLVNQSKLEMAGVRL